METKPDLNKEDIPTMLRDYKQLKNNLARELDAKTNEVVTLQGQFSDICKTIERLEKQCPKDLATVIQQITESFGDGKKVFFYNGDLKDTINELVIRAMHAHTHIKNIDHYVDLLRDNTDGDTYLGLIKNIRNELDIMKEKKCY